MKLRYPAEAFALGIILFSAGMKEAFAAGILVIFTSVFAELLKNLLEKAVPAWSLQLCVYILPPALSAPQPFWWALRFWELHLQQSFGSWYFL